MTHSSVLSSVKFALVAILCSTLINRGFGQKSGNLVPIKDDDADRSTLPTILIACLVRNKAHTLPYFLTTLENLDYPQDRIAIWIKSDHNEDNTTQILRTWGQEVQDWGLYHSVSIEIIDGPPFRQSDQETAFTWSSKRFQLIMRLKEEAVKVAKKIWADYIFFIDADVFLVNNQTLKNLVAKQKDLVAPMLLSGGMYSNFWGGMKDYYYVRSDNYKDILDSKITGCFDVPLIHSAVLMNIRKKNLPNYHPVSDEPEDDIIRFAVSAKAKGFTMEVCNDMEYGYVLSPMEDESSFNADNIRLQNLRVEIAVYWPDGLPVSDLLKQFVQQQNPPSTIGFDQTYLINLQRRPDRLQKMDHALEILGIDYTLIEAVDGT
ncbi:Glycosyltransferase 25 family member [Folsomia candida]|uniref:Glycosyltransferase 25 family member n=2 Tax=Folsomia candida TaxID=158441 RepID=A0A226CUV0_FOLCA|nr:Glycosyltransferase 25 family member [Folsomia candida]